jgi:signal transduction histidine kinase
MCHAYIIPFQFKQLLNNLISNSLKFAKTMKSPHVVITSELVKGELVEGEPGLSPKTTYCHLRVQDRGIGFQQKYADKIFQLFQRVHGKSELQGTGIGLAIVKKIVDNHNGIVRASSVPDRGSTFDIFIPKQNNSIEDPSRTEKNH